MNKSKYLISLAIILIIIFIGFYLLRYDKQGSKDNIFFYCAAGMKPPVETVALHYFKEYGIRVDLQYGGSGTLLNNLRIAQKGDIYLAADESYIDIAEKHNLIEEKFPVAYIRPVIGVHEGNPKKIQSIQDLLRPDIKVAIANPDAASIGKQTKKILQEIRLWDQSHAL